MALGASALALNAAASSSSSSSNRRFVHDQPGTWHSQYGQDATIHKLFADCRNCFFVDCAANEPLYLSNTRTLERDYGWRGVCIEGNRELVRKLEHQRSCQVVHALVGDSDGDEVVFSVRPDGIQSGFSRVLHNASEAGLQLEAERLANRSASPLRLERHKTMRLASILDRVSAPRSIDYLSLDVEGHEDAVLGRFPFDRYTFRAMTVERPSDALKSTLQTHGYHYVRNHGVHGDEFWVHGSIRGRAAALGLLK